MKVLDSSSSRSWSKQSCRQQPAADDVNRGHGDSKFVPRHCLEQHPASEVLTFRVHVEPYYGAKLE